MTGSMSTANNIARAVAAFFCLALLAAAPAAADWPAYRHDARRSGITDEALPLPLAKVWTYVCAQKPRPAWPPRVKLLNRTDYDYAPQLVVANGMVIFGSSADDTVRAVDATTGRERWHFTAGGPIRLAPQIYQGKVYFAADDGVVYCLDLESGRRRWAFRAAPWPDRMAGNNRIISRWPCRTGVVVSGGAVYCTAALWTNDGVYIYALDAATGDKLWVNGKGAFTGKRFQDSSSGNHQGEFGFGGLTPDGPLLFDRDVLVAPRGHAAPFRVSAASGQLLRGVKQGMARAVERVKKAVAAERSKGVPPPPAAHLRRAEITLALRGEGRPGGGGAWATIDAGKLSYMAMHRNRRIYLNTYDLVSGKAAINRHADRSIPQLALGMNRTVLPGRVSLVLRDGKIIARNAYDLVVANDALVLGHAGAVSVRSMADDKEQWRGRVSGEARGLAVAGARLYVSTSEGEISCFGPAAAAPETVAVHAPGKKLRQAPARPAVPAGEVLVGAVVGAGMDQGYALVLGEAEGAVTDLLAAQTRLHVVLAFGDERTVARLRRRYVAETNIYGTRVSVQHLPEAGKLPFAQYFANVVIVAGDPGQTPAAELYRVLRPCGGIMLLPGLDDKAAAFLDSSGALPDERQTKGGLAVVVRGGLPGVRDFDNPVRDPRVNWPLQPLWVGGPRPTEMSGQQSGENTVGPPDFAYGRFFVKGEESLTAVDAYNGTVLWTRGLPKRWPNLRLYHGLLRTVKRVAPAKMPEMKWRVLNGRAVYATRDRVSVRLGPGYMRGKGRSTVLLDARTGKQLEFAGPLLQGPAISLRQPRTWAIAMPAPEGEAPLDHAGESMAATSPDEGRQRLGTDGGLLTLRAKADGLVVELERRDATLTKFDLWELYFDFRPLPQRYGLYERGVFSVRVTPALDDAAPATCIPASGDAVPTFAIDGKRTAGGTEAVLRLSWREVEKITGAKPRSFGLAATFSSHDGSEDPKAPIRQRHLFGDSRAGGINNGWANVFLADVPDAAELAPAAALTENGQATPGWPGPRPGPPGGVGGEAALALRRHPLTGEMGPKVYRSGSWSCGGPTYSASTVFRRATKPAIGTYDFADDSGIRFVGGGVAASCGTSAVAAMGLFLFRDSRFRCDCSPPLKTSFALAPAERVYNEDWALFFDYPVTTRVRLAHLNLGAFGDRRDGQRNLWLSYPRGEVDRAYGYPFKMVPHHRRKGYYRPVVDRGQGVYLRHMPAGLPVPAKLTYDEGQGPYRRSSDLVEIAGADRPWLYTSGVAGIRELRLALEFMAPLTAVAAENMQADGDLAEAAWEGEPQILLPHSRTRVRLRFDAERLWLGVDRKALVDRKGQGIAWAKEIADDDQEIWRDDAFEVFLSDRAGSRVVHLGLSAGGARYDALAAGKAAEDAQWNMAWEAAVVANDKGLTMEFAIPFASLEKAGLQRDQLAVNLMLDQSDTRGDVFTYPKGEGRNWNLKNPTSESLHGLGAQGRRRCANFAPLGLGEPPEPQARKFTVKLHFAELDDVKAGDRVFDVRLQGKTVLADLDIVKEAGGARRAVVREFKGVAASQELVLEFSPSTPRSPPLLSALELHEEGFVAP